MDTESFTFEIIPENYESLNSTNDCFQLTLDVGSNCAPTFSPTCPGSSPAAPAGVSSWSSSQATWYHPAPTTCYYDPYYYNYGYYPAHTASPCVSGSIKNETLSASQTTSPLSSVPIVPAPVASQTSSQHESKQEIKPKSLQKRVPTPHPRRPSAAAAGTLASNHLKPASLNNRPKNKENSKDLRINYLHRPRASISERLNLLSLPSRYLSGGESKQRKASEIIGRPLWSANFSGANSPAQTAVPCKPKPGISSSLKSNSTTADKNNNPCEKHGSVTENKAAPSIKKNSEQPPGSHVVGQQASGGSTLATSSSPIVHYVSYNYRPVVLQSPTCGNGAIYDAAGKSCVFPMTASSAAAAPRFRTTSTLETVCSTEN